MTDFADDVAITIVAKTTAEMEDMANTAVRKVEPRLSLAGLHLAAHKTETVLISSRHLVETEKLTVGGVEVVSQRAMFFRHITFLPLNNIKMIPFPKFFDIEKERI